MPKPTRPLPEREPDSRRPRRGARPRADRHTPERAPRPHGDEPLVVVQFKGHRKSYYHNRAGVPVAPGAYCLVEADRGRDLGRVTYVGPGRDDWWRLADAQGVLAVAGEDDLRRLHDNRGDEWEFWDICQEKIRHRRLDMNLVAVERQFDHNKITFFFTAEQRVDFRALVRDLAAVFRTRIELRQIGVRDEARLKGGLGLCGREFCCSRFLHDFVPVTLKMAKIQQLPLNPGKLSGPCGRLRCCLTFENESYQEARKRLPRVGACVETPDGPGTVRRVDLLRRTAAVSGEGGDGPVEWPADHLRWDGAASLPTPRTERGGCGGGCGGNGGCGGKDPS
ncbi:stage 0 sporulation family protein [bacterium]|nr:stage 0 sporulation family protein [bacterium]